MVSSSHILANNQLLNHSKTTRRALARRLALSFTSRVALCSRVGRWEWQLGGNLLEHFSHFGPAGMWDVNMNSATLLNLKEKDQ